MSDTKTFVELLDFIRSETDHYLQKMDLPEEPAYLYDPIRFVLKGKGKRLRPVLVHISGHGFDADPEDLMHAGLAVELLHNFTLVHDDIMDDDDTRHGNPSVHKKFGNNSAILAGDSIFTLGQLMIGQVQTNIAEAIYSYNYASLSVCEGQALDLQFEEDEKISLDQYLNMIEKKTGALLSLCAELGGILGNQPKDVCQTLREYGTNLGKAFQVQDDILEIFSDPERMGKSLGTDVTAGKQTILTILAKKHDDWIKVRKSDGNIDNKLKQMRGFFIETGVKDRAQKMVNDYIQKAKASLSILKNDHKEIMEQFTEFVLDRTY